MELLDQVRDYLTKNGKSRQWLAEYLGVAKSTINGWYAGRTIPPDSQAAIQRLLTSQPSFDLRLSMTEWQRLSALAKERNMELEDLIVAIVKAAICVVTVGVTFLLR